MDYTSHKNSWLANRNHELKVYEEQVIKHLQSKYGKSFEVVGSIGRCLGLEADRWGVRPTDGGSPFLVLGYHKSGGYELSDSYLWPNLKAGFENELRKAIHSMSGQAKANIEVFAECSALECRLNSRITLLVREHGSTETVMDLCNIISKSSMSAAISWYAIADKHFYGINDIDASKKMAVVSGSAFVDRDYKIWFYNDMDCGFYDTTDHQLTGSQLERLCNIAYLDGIIDNSNMEFLGKILRYMKIFGFEGGCKMTSDEWNDIIDSMLSDKMLCRLKLVKSINVTECNYEQYPDILPGHRALCFVDPANAAYVIFRGTSGDYEWYDNAEGMVLAETTQQRAALKFVNEIAQLQVSQLTVAGHSKGGNKALFTAIASPSGMVNRCFSLDGQGFSEEFSIKYKESIISRSTNISQMAERRDFVNCLGIRLHYTDFRVGKRGDSSTGNIFGQSLPYFHCPDSCRDRNGELGQQCSEGSVSDLINNFITYFLTNPKYRDSRYDISVDIILIMMIDKEFLPDSASERIAKATMELTVVFCEMVANQKQFRDDIVGLMYTETDLILATAGITEWDDIDTASAPEDSIMTLYFRALKHEFIKNAEFRKDFINSLGYLSNLVRKIIREDNPKFGLLLRYINRSIKKLIKELAFSVVERVIADLISKLQKIINDQSNEEMI